MLAHGKVLWQYFYYVRAKNIFHERKNENFKQSCMANLSILLPCLNKERN